MLFNKNKHQYFYQYFNAELKYTSKLNFMAWNLTEQLSNNILVSLLKRSNYK